MLAAHMSGQAAAPLMSMDRNRSMMPPVMSSLTCTAVSAAPNPAQSSEHAGHHVDA